MRAKFLLFLFFLYLHNLFYVFFQITLWILIRSFPHPVKMIYFSPTPPLETLLMVNHVFVTNHKDGILADTWPGGALLLLQSCSLLQSKQEKTAQTVIRRKIMKPRRDPFQSCLSSLPRGKQKDRRSLNEPPSIVCNIEHRDQR